MVYTTTPGIPSCFVACGSFKNYILMNNHMYFNGAFDKLKFDELTYFVFPHYNFLSQLRYGDVYSIKCTLLYVLFWPLSGV